MITCVENWWIKSFILHMPACHLRLLGTLSLEASKQRYHVLSLPVLLPLHWHHPTPIIGYRAHNVLGQHSACKITVITRSGTIIQSKFYISTNFVCSKQVPECNVQIGKYFKAIFRDFWSTQAPFFL